jgi:hypothetical protein
MDTQELNVHIEREIELLQREFGRGDRGRRGAADLPQEVERLGATAVFNDFIPLLVHRRSRETLHRSTRKALTLRH